MWGRQPKGREEGAPKALSPLPLGFLPQSPSFLTSLLFCHNGVLAIRHTIDCVSNPVISGTLRSVRPRGPYRYLWIVRFLEISVTVQLYGLIHEIINNLSARKLFSAMLAVYFCTAALVFILSNNSLYLLSHSLFAGCGAVCACMVSRLRNHGRLYVLSPPHPCGVRMWVRKEGCTSGAVTQSEKGKVSRSAKDSA